MESTVAEETATGELSTFPQQRTCPMGIAPEYTRLREDQPIAKVRMHTGEEVWLITKYEYVRQVLADIRVSADRTNPGFPVLILFPDRESMLKFPTKTLSSMDLDEHTFHRRQLISEFTVKQVRALRPHIQEIVDGCVDDLLDSSKPADLVSVLALSVPARLVTGLLGVPYADRSFFERRTKIILDRKTPPPERNAANKELLTYIQDLIISKETGESDDLIGRLMARYRKLEAYDRQLLINLAGLLLTAGQETTASMITLGTVALLENPDQLAVIKQDPALLPSAIEELLRYFSVSADTNGYRVAREDIEIGGVTIREGEGIIALASAANRDPDAFACPEKLDVHRGARHHVAFGYGMHACLGQNLARAELEITLGTLFRRVPGLRLAVPLDEVPFKNVRDAAVYGAYELPVTW
jgi:cytochrome P450